MTIRFIPSMLLISILFGCSERPPSTQTPDHPNVILITLDTTRADHLSCYGHSSKISPNFDALAADGVRFDLAISTAAVTPVSHASILTGLNPYQHGVRVIYAASGFRLPHSIPTLATVLKNAGWSTGAFLSSFMTSEYFGLDQGFQIFDNGLTGDLDQKMKRQSDGHWAWGFSVNQRRSDQTTDRAIRWLRGVKGSFFAWIHYWDPHDVAILPPRRFFKRFWRKNTDPSKKRQGIYDLEIRYVDYQFGRLISTLKELNQYDNTLIVVTADHGQGLGDHGWWLHRILYQEQIRVPLIIRTPQGPHGKVVSDLTRSIDIFPTILDVVGVDAPMPVEGKSLVGLMNGQPEPPRMAYADQLNLYDTNATMLQKRPKDDLLYCAMDRSWKLIYRPRNPRWSELYHIAEDPREMNNLYPSNRQKAKTFLQALDTFNGWVYQPFGKANDPATLDRLRSLGYVGDDDSSEPHKAAPPQ